jgi:nucleotide-binding universal stress UspA family protein
VSPAGEQGGGFTVRRIVVAVDSSPHAQAALDAAAALAARMHAELEGLFVEDIDLLNLAALPFGREFNMATGQARPFDAGALREQMEAEIARMRRASAPARPRWRRPKARRARGC